MTAEKSSLLGDLAARRKAIAEKTKLRLVVPRWDDPAPVVTFKPVDSATIRKSLKKLEKADRVSGENATMDINADIVISACESIQIGDQVIESGFGDSELAEALGVTSQSARAVCRALYVTDGDLLRVANQLIEWSGYQNEQADQEFAGE